MIKVQKRDGRIVNYDREKIVRAIQKANAEVDAAEQMCIRDRRRTGTDEKDS